ncbi:glycosyltransferase [Candidatus Pelagibacter sp.]|nr:glycosyltransferase [Candidatus Pelagibacter sp.]
MKIKKKINIYFTVDELSQYMYFLLKYINKKLKKFKNINFKVISTEFSYKISFKEKNEFFNNIIWINQNKIYSWHDLKLEVPDIYFQSGWNKKPFNHLLKLTKQKNKNSKIILTSDNSYQKGKIRQILGGIFFKIFLRKKFDLVWVPGLSGKKLMIKFGFEEKKIFTKMYCSLIDVYKNRKKVKKRKKQLLFVGQFVKRKNVERLIDAFKSLNVSKKEWKLLLVGKGNLDLKKNNTKNIKIIDHLLPSKLSKLYNESLFFILPSIKDHWGLVVHEASLCGCFLLLSKNVGSIEEFSNNKNSIIFDPNSKSDLQKSLIKAMTLSSKQLNIANKESEKLAGLYNYKNSYIQFIKIVNNFTKIK